jgi:hypothetical protein
MSKMSKMSATLSVDELYYLSLRHCEWPTSEMSPFTISCDS